MTPLHLSISTEQLTPEHAALLRLALSSEILKSLGIYITVRCGRWISCRDGEVFDAFPWVGDIVLGGGGVQQLIAASASTFDGSVAEYIQRLAT